MSTERAGGSGIFEAAQAYLQAGWVLCRIRPGTKVPMGERWNETGIRSAALFAECGIGLIHEHSRTACIDIDDLEGAEGYLQSRAVDLGDLLQADDAVRIDSGRPGRAKLLYRLPEGMAPLTTRKVKGRDGRMLLEFRCAGAQDVLPPTQHPSSGKTYAWAGAGDWRQLPELPEKLRRLWVIEGGTRYERPAAEVLPAEPVEAIIGEGGRNDTLASLAGTMRRKGMTREAIEAALLTENANRCRPPLTDAEVRAIAASVARYEPGAAAQPAAAHLAVAPEPPLDVFRELSAPTFADDLFPAVLARFGVLQAAAAGHDTGAYLMAGLAAAAGAISDQVRVLVDSRSDWFESPRLWVMLLGTPGAGKSPAVTAAMKELWRMHGERREAYEVKLAACRDDDPKPTPEPLVVADVTIESLSELLKQTPRGLLCQYHELDSWLGAHDTYRGNKGRDRGEWLRLFDGGPHQVERVQRGSVFVPNWGTSILGASTWDALARHAKDLPVDGLLQRFLPVCLQHGAQPDDTLDPASVAGARDAFAARLRALYALPPMTMCLGDDAARALRELRASLHKEVDALHGLSPALSAHVSKHAAMAARVALVMHCLEHGAEACALTISGATMSRAIALLRVLRWHAMVLYDRLGTAHNSARVLAKQMAAAIVADRLEVVTRTALTHRCRAFRDAAPSWQENALQYLVDAAWLTPLQEGRIYAGRVATYSVAAEVHERFAQHGAAHQAQRNAVKVALRMGGAANLVRIDRAEGVSGEGGAE